MNWFIVLLCFGFVYLSYGDERYTDRYDSINLNEILENRRLLVPYIKCILGKGRCTPEGKELKNNIKDGIQTSCEKCTEFQKKGVRKVVKHLKEQEKDYWEEIKAKWDPNNRYQESYEAFLARDD